MRIGGGRRRSFVAARIATGALLALAVQLAPLAAAYAATEIVTATSARFSWLPASGPVAGYNVYVARNGESGPGSLLTSTPADQLQVVVNGNYGDTIVLRVAAFGALGEEGPLSAASDEVEFDAPPIQGIDVDAPLAFVAVPVAEGVHVQAWRLDGSLAGTIDVAVPLGVDPAVYTDLRAARCDVDGDGVKEVVFGFGPGSSGMLQLFTSEIEGFAPIASLVIAGGSYNASVGATRPTCGDFDGDGRDELAVGRDTGGFGRVDVFEDETAAFAWTRWLESSWSQYRTAEGSTWPTAGDFDGDGHDELVVGLGAGWYRLMHIYDDAARGFRAMSSVHSTGFVRVLWDEAAGDMSGATFPAAADIDGDGVDELLVGLDSESQGLIYIADNEVASGAVDFQPYPTLLGGGLLQTGWEAYNASVGITQPAAADIDGDAVDEILVGFAEMGQGLVELVDPVVDAGLADLVSQTEFLQDKSWALAPSGVDLAH